MISKKEAQALIAAMIDLRDSATNEQAKNVAILYPKWEENKNYQKGERFVYENNLYIVKDEHTSDIENLPDTSVILYELISD